MRLLKPKENNSPTMKIARPETEVEWDGYPQLPLGHGSLRPTYLIETDEALNLIKANPSDLRVVNAMWYIPGIGDADNEHLLARLHPYA